MIECAEKGASRAKQVSLAVMQKASRRQGRRECLLQYDKPDCEYCAVLRWNKNHIGELALMTVAPALRINTTQSQGCMN